MPSRFYTLLTFVALSLSVFGQSVEVNCIEDGTLEVSNCVQFATEFCTAASNASVATDQQFNVCYNGEGNGFTGVCDLFALNIVTGPNSTPDLATCEQLLGVVAESCPFGGQAFNFQDSFLYTYQPIGAEGSVCTPADS